MPTDSFEIQRFVETNKPIETVARPIGIEAANKAFREACNNSPGTSFRMIQIIIDFTTIKKHATK